MKKQLQRILFTVLIILLGGVNSAWAAALTDNLEVTGYVKSHFFDFVNRDFDGTSYTSNNDLANLGVTAQATVQEEYAAGTWYYYNGLRNQCGGGRWIQFPVEIKADDYIIINGAAASEAYEISMTDGTSTTIASASDYLCFKASKDMTALKLTVHRYNYISQILIMTKDASASTADYTINYLLNGEGDPVKVTSGTEAVGQTVNAENSFWVDGVKYFLSGEQTTSMTITSSTNVLNLSVREAETYTYTVNASYGDTQTKELASGSVYEGESATVAYPEFIFDGTTLYSIANNGTGDWFRKAITPTSTDFVETLTYNKGNVENVAFYTEAEDIEGVSTGNNTARASKGQMGYTANNETYKDVTTLPAGKYIIYLKGVNGNSAARTANFKVGENIVFTTSIPNGTNTRINSEEFTVEASAMLSFACEGSSASGVDWFYVVKTGDYVNPYIVSGYTVDFNTEINTSSHDFAVATKWKHIVQDNDGYYVTYKWDAAYGVGETGGLLVYSQKVGSSSWDMANVYDLLVTPKVSGTIKLKVKAYENASSSTKAFVQLWSVNGTATEKDTQLKEFQTEIPGYSTGSGDWVELTYDVTEAQRIGIRAQYVYIDEFSADEIDTTPEAALVVSSVMNSDGQTGTNGTNPKFEEQADGNMKVILKVQLTNSGDVDFVAGTTENYTLTVGQASYLSGTKTYYEDATIAIPEDLAAGETKTFDVEFTVPYISGYKYWYVRENVTGTTSTSYRYATSVAYEPKFVFRVAESTSTSSLSATQAYGLISEETTKNFEIANTGTAPLTIKSITLPEGFASANMPVIPEEGLVVAKGAVLALDITLPVDVQGHFADNLTIVYLDKNAAEQTYTLAFSGDVLSAGTWAADFNGDNAIAYPAGSIAEGGINSDYQYADGAYNYYIVGRTTSSYASENNKFITPKLHATAGQQLSFDVKGAYGSSYYAKVYVSADRKNWGEPVAYYTYGEKDGAEAIGSSDWVNKAITFDAEGDYYVAFSLYGEFKIDNIIGLTKVDVAHDLYIKSVNWPDASIKSGTSQSKPSLDVIPLTDETAESYTMKYVCGETVLAEGTPVDLTASVNSSRTLSFSWTPVVESTTVYPATKVVFEFTDGTKIESEPFDLTVTNEPIFHFVKTLPSNKWNEPSDYTTPISFGKTNTADAQTFYVYNWGSAPLTVKSIAVPAGFTATPAEQFVVAAFDETDMSVAAQAVEITFSATEAGTYSGNMVITYVDGNGADQTFELAVSGTKLDPSKFYANFDDGGWPAGSVYQSSISSSNGGTYSAPNYYISSSSTTNNIFVTPKLTAVAGEKLLFDAKLYNEYSSWSTGSIKVYAAATREEVLNTEEGTTRQLLYYASGSDTEADATITANYNTFEYTITNSGDYFFGFEISGGAKLDEIYGLTSVAVAHDWMIASSNIPTEAMQNVASKATVNILNLGLAEESADSYTATLYVAGEAAATAEGVAIPMSHKLSDAGTQLSFNFRSPKVGTFPVYIEVKAGEYSVATEPVEVTFVEEVAVADAIEVGTKTSSSSSNAIIDFYNLDGGAKTSDILYTAAQLNAFGIIAGSKITKLAFKGNISSAKSISNSLTVWYGLSTGDIEYNAPNKEAMTEVTIFDGTMNFVAGVNEIAITLGEPLVYDGESDLRFYFEGTKGGWASVSFDYDNDYQNMKWSNSYSMKGNPLLYVTLAAEPAAIAGTVKNDETNVPAATVTLVSTDGDNVQYAGTVTDGKYSVNVIQAGRTYDVTVNDGKTSVIAKNVAFADGNVTKNFNFGTLTLDGDATDGPADAVWAKVTGRNLNVGWNAVVLPFAIAANEVVEKFGEGTEIAAYDGDNSDSTTGGTDYVTVNFATTTAIEANVPYLVYVAEAVTPEFENVDVAAAEAKVEGNYYDFVGVYAKTEVNAGDYFMKRGALVKATTNNYVLAYRSYLKLHEGESARSIRFTLDGEDMEDETTGIKVVNSAAEATDGIYNLSGQKLQKTQKGFNIINGKKVVIK